MATLDELASGAYTSPDPYALPRTPVPFGYGPAGGGPVGPDPNRFRGGVGPHKNIVPWSAISPSSFAPEGGFKRGRQAQFQRRFRKGPLGEFETVDTIRAFGSPEGDVKRDFTMTTAGQLADLIGGFTRGIGSGTGEMLGMGRRLASLAPAQSALGQVAPSLPTQEQIMGGIGGALGPFVPPRVAAQVGSEPRTPLGQTAGAAGEFAPYMAMGVSGLGRRLLPYLYGGNSILP